MNETKTSCAPADNRNLTSALLIIIPAVFNPVIAVSAIAAILAVIPVFVETVVVIPVSYTHLDVYKRQISNIPELVHL